MDVVSANAADFVKLTPSHLCVLRRIGLDALEDSPHGGRRRGLKTSLAAAISEQLHGEVEIHNEYGPTEAVVGCVAHLYDPAWTPGASVPIGVPADHVRVEILNDALSPVPEGVPGELWVSRSVWRAATTGWPTQTDERFIAAPGAAGRPPLPPGDLVRMSRPGTLEYLGRIDRQVKISGYPRRTG